MSTETYKGGIVLKTGAFSALAKALKAEAPEIATALQANLRKSAGNIPIAIAALTPWSRRIGASARVTGSGFNVNVLVGGKRAPNAGPINNHGRGNVRHPTFGHDPYTSKNSHRAFFQPAVDGQRPFIADAVYRTVSLSFNRIAAAITEGDEEEEV